MAAMRAADTQRHELAYKMELKAEALRAGLGLRYTIRPAHPYSKPGAHVIMQQSNDQHSVQTSEPPLSGLVRKLWPTEVALFRDHLLRLDGASRHLRFGHGVSDSFIEDYASGMLVPGSLTYAFVQDGIVRAAGELKRTGGIWGCDAEAALSIESTHQNKGIGTLLLGRLIRCARNRGVQHVILNCHAENERMQAIAKKHEAGLRIELGEVTGEIIPAGSHYFSLLEEAADDRAALIFGLLDMQIRIRAIGLSAIGLHPGTPAPHRAGDQIESNRGH